MTLNIKSKAWPIVIVSIKYIKLWKYSVFSIDHYCIRNGLRIQNEKEEDSGRKVKDWSIRKGNDCRNYEDSDYNHRR